MIPPEKSAGTNLMASIPLLGGYLDTSLDGYPVKYCKIKDKSLIFVQ